MKVLERLVSAYLRPLVRPSQDPLQIVYQPLVRVEDDVTVRIMFFDLFSAFNTIQPRLLRAKLVNIQVDELIVTCRQDYLTGKTKFVRLQSCVSERLISNIGALQGTVNRVICRNILIVGCVESGHWDKYIDLVGRFVSRCWENYLQLNVAKNHQEQVPIFSSLHTVGVTNVETVKTYKYLETHLDNDLEWATNRGRLEE
ncbi:uncharacterized protein LOC121711184, partial [Tachysurus ichikawai]